MSRWVRIALVLSGLLGAGALLYTGTAAAWRQLVTTRVERKLTAALGHSVTVGAVRPGWRGLVARDIDIQGAPPFEAAAVVHLDRADLEIGRAPDGSRRIEIAGFELDYLRKPAADNVRGVLSGLRNRGEPTMAQAVSSWPVHATGGNVRVFLDDGAGHRVFVRLQDVAFDRGAEGPLLLRARRGALELAGTLTVELSGIFVEMAPSLQHGSFHGEAAQLRLAGAEPLLYGLQIEGRFGSGHLSFDARHGSPGRQGSVELRVELGERTAVIALDSYALPLAALRPLIRQTGLSLERAQASVHGAAELDAENSRLLFDLDLDAQHLDVHHRAIDTQPWTDMGARAHLQGELRTTPAIEVRLRDSRIEALGLPVSVDGALQISPAGRGELTLATGGAGSGAPQPIDCADLLRRQATPVRSALAGLELDGSLRASAKIGFDASTLEVLSLSVDVPQECQTTREPAVLESIGLATDDVIYNGRDESGRERPFPLGPSNPGFSRLREIPSSVKAAFLTAEDYSFRAHRGFDLEMIRRAANYDLRTSSFGKGASTISQQLAKNLFLRPDRNLARKLEEAVFTWRLESLLSKDRILELYLNAVELGAGIHGVKSAARAYFGKPLALLTPLEAAHMAALAPNPRVYARQFREGHIDPAWLQHLDDLLAAMQRRRMLPPGTLQSAHSTALRIRGM